MQGEDMHVVEPGAVPVAAEAEPAFYFPSGYTLQPSPDEPEIYEFY